MSKANPIEAMAQIRMTVLREIDGPEPVDEGAFMAGSGRGGEVDGKGDSITSEGHAEQVQRIKHVVLAKPRRRSFFAKINSSQGFRNLSRSLLVECPYLSPSGSTNQSQPTRDQTSLRTSQPP
jgi:hypothetical protein